MELIFGHLRHPDADRIERELLDKGADPETARLTTVLGQPIEEIERRKATPLLALDYTFRPQASLIVLWAVAQPQPAATAAKFAQPLTNTAWQAGCNPC